MSRRRTLVWRAFRKGLPQRIDGDVVNGDMTFGFALGAAVMGVAVKHRRHREAIERLLKRLQPRKGKISGGSPSTVSCTGE